MSTQCSIKGVPTTIRTIAKNVGKKTIVFTLVFVLGMALVEPAGAIETTRASGFITKLEDTTSLQPSPSRDLADACLPLLKKVRHTSPVSAMDPSRRPAGHKAATVGFVLGLRIALGPTEVTGSKRVTVGPQIIESRDESSGYALAIADYRRCKNEQALKTLNNQARWSN